MQIRWRWPWGFALVEVLVAVAIVSVLVGLLVPTVGSARRASGRVAGLSNLRQAGLALAGYADDHGGQLPACYGDDTAGGHGPRACFDSDVRPYAAGLALLFRWPPTYAEPPHVVPQAYLASGRPLVCPGEADRAEWQTVATGLLWGRSIRNPRWLEAYELGRTSYLYEYVPTLTPADGNYDPALAGLVRSTLRAGGASRTSILFDWCLAQADPPGADGLFVNWHDGRSGGNVLYLDGHARWWDGPSARRASGPVTSDARVRALASAIDH